MTGRELILYILQNHLEDEPIFKEDGSITGFLTVGPAAEKVNVGTATVYAWIEKGLLPYILVGNRIFIRADFEPPQFERGINNG